ncbi:hypothetical protein, partial [Streptomyces sp. NPDC008125]|uniref:hypothetical protein n=1 Tax=Streptomyces sp. NPDC008125 TaxID=3364811 RepID=UPI0036F13A39
MVTTAAAAQTAPARVSARVDADQEQPPTLPQRPAGPVKDWDLPGLPADCKPGCAPELLTDEQSRARIRYGHSLGWA